MKKGDKCIFVRNDSPSAKRGNLCTIPIGTVVILDEDGSRNPYILLDGEIAVTGIENLAKIPDELLNEDPQTILLYFAL